MSRLDDANDDVNLSMNELADPHLTFSRQLRPVVRVLASIAVSLAIMIDRAAKEGTDGR